MDKRLGNDIHDAMLVRVEVNGKVVPVHLAGFAIRLVQDALAAASKGSGLAGFDEFLYHGCIRASFGRAVDSRKSYGEAFVGLSSDHIALLVALHLVPANLNREVVGKIAANSENGLLALRAECFRHQIETNINLVPVISPTSVVIVNDNC